MGWLREGGGRIRICQVKRPGFMGGQRRCLTLHRLSCIVGGAHGPIGEIQGGVGIDPDLRRVVRLGEHLGGFCSHALRGALVPACDQASMWVLT